MAFVTASASPSSSRLLGRGCSSSERAAATTGSEDWPSASLFRNERNDGIWSYLERMSERAEEEKMMGGSVRSSGRHEISRAKKRSKG